MNTNTKIVSMETTSILSTLWMFVLFNMIFRDLHEFFRPGLLEEMMTGIVNGTQMTDGVLLVGGVMVEIPISMVLLSRVLKDQLNRWTNIIAGTITIAFVIGMGQKDLDDLFFATMEVLALSLIVWCAWKWRKQEA